MKEALNQAKLAFDEGEVPVGAVIVFKDEIIATGRNRREISKNALGHAEVEAINDACNFLESWRLCQCELFVTLEPCPMCAGAIINSRIQRLVFGCHDEKSGSCGSVINLFDLPYNHKPLLESGILKEECSSILKDFFRGLRNKNTLRYE